MYNVVNLGQFVTDCFENCFNFCAELKLLKCSHSCPRCRRSLKLSVENHCDHCTPVVFHCTNAACRMNYISVRQGSFLECSHLSLEQVLLFVNLFCGKKISKKDIVSFMTSSTHCPLTNRPFLYCLRFPNLLSSTVMVRPGPLIKFGVSSATGLRRTSQQQLNQMISYNIRHS